MLVHKISISEKSIATLLGHAGSGKRCFGMVANKDKIAEIANVIFKNGKSSSNAKDLHDNLRIWFKIIIGWIHHRKATNSLDYINIDQKYMLYYLEIGEKINLPLILFKYLREMVKETRN